MNVFEYLGRALTHQKLVPGNTITSLGSEFYKYAERLLAFSSGGTTEIVVGDWIVGVTSSAKAQVIAVTLASGTWGAGSAAGTFKIRSQHGTFQAENIKVAAGTDDATIPAGNGRVLGRQELLYPEYSGLSAKAALVSVYANTALTSITGGKPDQTALIGQPMVANSSWLLRGIGEITAFKCVDYTASSASVVNVTFFF